MGEEARWGVLVRQAAATAARFRRAPATAARRPLEARPGGGRGSRSDGAGTRVVLERRLGCMRHGGPQISGRGRGIAASSSHGAGHEGPSGGAEGTSLPSIRRVNQSL